MIPDTHYSLIHRLSSDADNDAWGEFQAVYLPVVYNHARSNGLQDADAQDVAQQVMISIARALSQRPHDQQRAKFRTWLFRVTRNAVINAIQRRPHDRATGDSQQTRLLNEVPLSSADESQLEADYKRSVFRWAAERIQSEFAEHTWRAFWLTMIDGHSCEEVAELLGKEIGSIYAARSRIVRRLRKKVEEFDESSHIF